MPEPIRALAFILIAIILAYGLFNRVFSQLIGQQLFKKLVITYIFILFSAAISPGYWFFLLLVLFYIYFLSPDARNNRLAYYFMLLLAVPNFWLDIPGFGVVRFIMTMSYPRFLILVLLLTLLLNKQTTQTKPYRYLASDTILTLYILLKSILGFRDDTLTNAARESLMLFIDIFLPYFVISRHIGSTEQFRQLLAIFLFVMLCLSLVAVIELVKSWHLYNPFIVKLGTQNPHSLYLFRSGMLRASTVFYSPIALGYAITLAFAAYLYLRPMITTSITQKMIAFVLLMGLGASLSRGPWLGFVILMLTFTFLQKGAIQKTFKALTSLLVALPLLSLTPYWDKFISLLPFIGTVEAENITYRQRLIDNAWLVFQKYPLFGSPNFQDEPEMQRMIQGQGIIDVVNSYIGVVLEIGAIGLFLFVFFFVWLLLKAYRLTRIIEESDEKLYRLGLSLISAMTCTMFTISTVSSIDYIPYLYWSFSGLLAAYIILVKEQNEKQQNV